jgi:hypothetical protein
LKASKTKMTIIREKRKYRDQIKLDSIKKRVGKNI